MPTNYTGTFLREEVMNFTKHNHLFYYVNVFIIYCVKTVIIYLTQTLLCLILLEKSFSLFSCKKLLLSHNLFYYCVLRVSSLDALYLCNIKNYNDHEHMPSVLSVVEINQMSLK